MKNISIAVLYEHPEWFKPLFAELDRRKLRYHKLWLPDQLIDPSVHELPYQLVVNRVSAFPSGGSHQTIVLFAKELLKFYERMSLAVINGAKSFEVGASKAAQLSIFEQLGCSSPKARVIHHPSQIARAAEGLQFPILLKPNIGGSGAGIRRFNSLNEIQKAVETEQISLGIDGIALVQEMLPAKDSCVYRVEILNGEFLYALRVPIQGGSFNYCPADGCNIEREETREKLGYCATDTASLSMEKFVPPADLVDQAKKILECAGVDVGGVEYLVSEKDGKPYFFDINPLSNFVADAERVVGFDPYPRFVDYIVKRAEEMA